jgi:hypothetical protein
MLCGARLPPTRLRQQAFIEGDGRGMRPAHGPVDGQNRHLFSGLPCASHSSRFDTEQLRQGTLLQPIMPLRVPPVEEQSACGVWVGHSARSEWSVTPLKTTGGSAWYLIRSAWSLIRSSNSRLIGITSSRSDAPQN